MFSLQVISPYSAELASRLNAAEQSATTRRRAEHTMAAMDQLLLNRCQCGHRKPDHYSGCAACGRHPYGELRTHSTNNDSAIDGGTMYDLHRRAWRMINIENR